MTVALDDPDLHAAEANGLDAHFAMTRVRELQSRDAVEEEIAPDLLNAGPDHGAVDEHRRAS
jgi:hypothetical protein